MKIHWRSVWDAFWDRLAQKIDYFGVDILAGDFNMSLTRVVPELRSRGFEVDCIAWHPWLHATERCHGQPLGFVLAASFTSAARRRSGCIGVWIILLTSPQPWKALILLTLPQLRKALVWIFTRDRMPQVNIGGVTGLEQNMRRTEIKT